MKMSQYYIPTLKTAPNDADTISTKLMFKAGMIRKSASGIYQWLPLGLKVLKKIEAIVREELDKIGANEVSMPLIQPKHLWEKSGRWKNYGKELMRIKDRKSAEFCFSPTAEEVFTDSINNDINSYKQLPIILYQINSKFRDEIRPRFGVMRAREFVMKDAYSFDDSLHNAKRSYDKVFEVYNKILKRCGLKYKAVEADTGNIGGNYSHEFMVMAQTGENDIVSCESCGYTANIEKAESMIHKSNNEDIKPQAIKVVDTPNMGSVEEVSKFLNIPSHKFIKTILYECEENYILALTRGDRQLNEVKLNNCCSCSMLIKASDDVYREVAGCDIGYITPVGIKDKKLKKEIIIIADNSIRYMKNSVTGANETNKHMINVSVDKDFSPDVFCDISITKKNDICGRCKKGRLNFSKGIEVGHTFMLGSKYSQSMGATFLDEKQKSQFFHMGCYGIGITRIVAASIEQNNDEKGITWTKALSPFSLHLICIDEKEGKQQSDDLYRQLISAGIDVLYDDTSNRAGVKFSNADLLGIPHRLVISKKTLSENKCEYKSRIDDKTQMWDIKNTTANILKLIKN